MMSFLESLENTGPAVWVRDADTVFAYPTVLAIHTFGLALLVGLTVALALRLLGIGAELPLAPFRKFFPFVWIGFWLDIVSGILLFLGDARKFAVETDFYVKLLGISVGVAIVRALQTRLSGDPAAPGAGAVSWRDKTLAAALLVTWVVTVTAGRLTAYDGFIQWQTSAAVLILSVVLLAAGFTARRLAGWSRPARPARAAASHSL
jgi:hypothetical protein